MPASRARPRERVSAQHDRGCFENQGRAGAHPAVRGGGRRGCRATLRSRDARKAAIGAFAALGLPHRRIEEWKYTDLRNALKEALPPALAGDASVSRQEIDAALEGLAGLDAYRVVFVDGRYRAELSDVAGAKGLEVGPLAAALPKSEGLVATALAGPGGRDCAQHRLHDRRRAGAHRRRREAGKAPAAGVRPRSQAAEPRHHAQHRAGRCRRARHADRGLRHAARARRPARPTR